MNLCTFDVASLPFVAHSVKENSAGRNYGVEKEMIRATSVLGIVHGHIAELAIGRWYRGRSKNANTVYATVWFNVYGEPTENGRVYVSHVISGTGRSSGYGCENRSGAMNQALISACFELRHRETGAEYAFDCASVSVADDAIMACCVALGYTEKLCHIVHG